MKNILKKAISENYRYIVLEHCGITDDQFIELMNGLLSNKHNVIGIWCHIGNKLTNKSIEFISKNLKYIIGYYLWIYGNSYSNHIDESRVNKYTYMELNNGRINQFLGGKDTDMGYMNRVIKTRIYKSNF